MSLGTKILEHRKKAGLSQEELGYKLNVTRQSVSLWENNQAQPTLENLISLSKILNVSISELCGEKEDASNSKNEEKDNPLFKASICYNEEIYVNAYKHIYLKYLLFILLALLLSVLILIGILSSEYNNFSIVPILCIIVFALYIFKFIYYMKKNSKEAVKLKPNLKVIYSFYDDYFIIDSKSDNSNAIYNKKYSEIKTKTQDSEYIYLTFDGFFTVIDKKTCIDYKDSLIQLIGLKRKDNSIKNKNKILLLIFFLLSLFSIHIALMIAAISMSLSPLPDFPLAMTEHMWKFYIVVPIPLVSVVLGIIFLKKGYKCKKNIVAGIIITVFLCVFGNFTSIFSNQISHDMSYLEPISEKINLEIPTDGYISIMYDYQIIGDSLAMVKINDENFTSKLENDINWNKDISFIPSNKIDFYLLTISSEYNYFMVYNLTNNSYNNFDGEIIYLAYNSKSNTLLIYSNN